MYPPPQHVSSSSYYERLLPLKKKKYGRLLPYKWEKAGKIGILVLFRQ
jgi:hypothetical protein